MTKYTNYHILRWKTTCTHDMEPKKLLILSMICNKGKYIRQKSLIRQTWGKDILEKKVENVELFFFTSSEDGKNCINYDKNTIFVNSGDELINTAEKTAKTLIACDNLLNFDYLVITNSSTVLNVNLIYKFINSEYINEDKYYGGELLYQGVIPFFRGDFILFHKNKIQSILKPYDLDGMKNKNANDNYIFYKLHFNDCNNLDEYIDKLLCVKCIGNFLKDFCVNEIGKNFYIRAKIDKVKEDIILNNVVGAYSFLSGDKNDYDLSELIFKPTKVETDKNKLEDITSIKR